MISCDRPWSWKIKEVMTKIEKNTLSKMENTPASQGLTKNYCFPLVLP